MDNSIRVAQVKRDCLRWLAACALGLAISLHTPGTLAVPPSPTPTPSPTPVPTTTLSDNPMVLVTPTHPQVLLVLPNSQSMDGNLSGAIMTGASGTYSINDPKLTGFTPPVQAADGSGNALYTSGGKDNSPSRMNVAKASIQRILNDYASSNDFGLMTLGTSGNPALYTTWVYYMSAAGGFTFTNTAGTNTYPNPCYNVSSTACTALAGRYGSGVSNQAYFVAAGPSDGSSSNPGSSDDPQVNDVLYAPSSLPSVAVVYGGPNPPTPFPPNYSLTDYNNGNILETYSNSTPAGGARQTGPTNAGYVPFAPETMYAQRGFGYYNPVTNTGVLRMPIDVDSSTRQASFSALLAPETNTAGSGEIKSNAVNAATAGVLKTAYQYYTGTGAYDSPPPTNNGCTAKQYVVLISDGLPTWDLNNKAWPPLGSIAAAGYGVTATIDSSGILTSTNNQAVNDTLAQITNLNGKGIRTYVIGMGAGVDPSKNPTAAATLKAMAKAGGTNDYFPATSPADVSNDMVVILEQIKAANASTTSSAVNSTNIRTGSYVYQATFNSLDGNKDWTGDVLEFALASNGTVNTLASNAQWRAQAQLDAATFNWDTSRRIVTINPSITSTSHPSGTGVPFRWSATAPATAINTTQQGYLMTSASDTLGPNRLNYLRGDKSNEQGASTPGPFRTRSHLLGDIANSNPVYVGDAFGPYPDASYQTFQGNKKGRTPIIYVGGNDGMLHAFDAATGNELFAYIPNGVFNRLINLTQPTYNTAHKFYVDGSPTAGDAQFSDGTWHTLLAGGLNNGGNSIYALDVTDPPTASNSEATIAAKVLWEFTDSTNMGRTFSRPAIARISVGNGNNAALQSVVVFGSGYNNSNNRLYLYIVDAQTGAMVGNSPVDLCAGQSSACDLTKANGLSSPAVVSPDGTGTVNMIYVGDLQGNLWKVDLSANTWSGQVLFKATNPAGNPEPITTTPVTSLHPKTPQYTGNMVYFGTGRFVGLPDVTDTSVQSVYGIWDNGSNTAPTRSNDLVAQTITTVTTSQALFNGQTQVRNITSNAIDWATKRGWYFDLPLSGERVITDPRLVTQRLAFTTFTPSTDVCAGGGQSWLMVVNYANGGAFPKPELDIYGDDSYAQVNNLNPVGVSLGSFYAASPTFIGGGSGGSGGGGGDTKLISKSNGKIDSLREKGGAKGRESWTQIQ